MSNGWTQVWPLVLLTFVVLPLLLSAVYRAVVRLLVGVSPTRRTRTEHPCLRIMMIVAVVRRSSRAAPFMIMADFLPERVLLIAWTLLAVTIWQAYSSVRDHRPRTCPPRSLIMFSTTLDPGPCFRAWVVFLLWAQELSHLRGRA